MDVSSSTFKITSLIRKTTEASYSQVDIRFTLEWFEIELVTGHGPGPEQERAVPRVGAELVGAGALIGGHGHPQHLSFVEHRHLDVALYFMIVPIDMKDSFINVRRITILVPSWFLVTAYMYIIPYLLP